MTDKGTQKIIPPGKRAFAGMHLSPPHSKIDYITELHMLFSTAQSFQTQVNIFGEFMSQRFPLYCGSGVLLILLNRGQ